MKSRHPEPDSSVDWLALIANVKGDDPKGRGELDRVFSSGIRFYLSRRGVQHLEARIQETLTMLAGAIRTETLREHEPLAGLVRTIVLRQVAAYGDADAQNPNFKSESPRVLLEHGNHPAKKTIHPAHRDRLVTQLRSMSRRDQEALTRFYCHDQPPERICQEMRLSETQFRRLKARFKSGVF